MDPYRNITRIDNDLGGDHAWVVTLRRKGTSVVKRFSDGVYGGKQKALKAAVKYRDSFLARDNPFEQQIWTRTRIRKNNTSGIPGVGRYEVMDNPNSGSVRAFWLDSWIDEHGASRKRKFSVARYGEEEARLLAIAERNYQLRRVCAINAAARGAKPPGQAKVWVASRAKEGRHGEGDGSTRERNGDPKRENGEAVQVVEATIDEHGNVKLLKPVELTSTRCALVTIFVEAQGNRRAEG